MGIRNGLAATGVVLLTGGLVGCLGGSSGGGGNGDGDVREGKSTPGQLSVVVAKSGEDEAEASSSGVMTASSVVTAQETMADDADYNQDKPSVWVHDPSIEPLEMVNMILCSVKKTGSQQLVNQEPYLALLDPSQCEQGENTSGGAGGGGQATNEQVFEEWTVVSEQTSAGADHNVQFWLEPDTGDEEFQERIMGDVRIIESADEDRPFGHFEMAFRGETASSGGSIEEGTPVFVGELSSVDREDGSAQFEFYMKASDEAPMEMDMWAHVVIDDKSGESGRARTFINSAEGEEQTSAEFTVAFDENRMLRENQSTSEAFCGDRNDVDVSIWRYNLYHRNDTTFNGNQVSAGERVRIRGGFPFRTEINGTMRHGHIGYHGLWLDAESVDMEGRTIIRGRGESAEEYTVEVIGGKLERRKRSVLGITEAQGDRFYWYEGGQDYQVTVDVNYDFYKTHTVEWTDTGPEATELAEADKEVITPTTDGERLWLWHDSLGGNVIYRHDSAVSPSAREINFFEKEQIVVGNGDALFDGSDTVTLWCQWNCIKGGLTQSDIDGGTEQDWFYDRDNPGGGPWEYQIDSQSLELIDMNPGDGSTPAVTLRGLDIPEGHLLEYGERFRLATDANKNADNYETLDVSYDWQTGPREWSWRHRAKNSDGEIRRFEEPLRFAYQHSTENDANGDSRYDGRRMQLEYEGRGELHGFPWEQDEDGRWRSPVNLAEGTVLSSDGQEFLVRGMEMEQSMNNSDVCGDMQGDLPNESTLPAPDEPSSEFGFTWDDRPDVDDEPRVIGGEIQED